MEALLLLGETYKPFTIGHFTGGGEEGRERRGEERW